MCGSVLRMSEPQTYFTKDEAAKYLRCSPRYIDTLRERHELSAMRLNRKKLLFARADLDALAQRHKPQTVQEQTL
jgi:excisionase family DNA binding protein